MFVLLAQIVLLALLAGCGGGDQDQAGQETKSTSLVPAGSPGEAVRDTGSAAQVESAYQAGTLVVDQGVSVDADPGSQAAGAALKPAQSPGRSEIPTDSGAPSQAAAARPVTSASAGDGAFNLQLGSFTNLDNARRQADRIRGLGYEPVIEASDLGGQIYHRVMLKSVGDMAEASRLGEHIHSELDIAYLVRRAK